MSTEMLDHMIYPLVGDRRLTTDPDPGARGNSVSISSKLWRRLPTEVLGRVLLFLPTEDQIRLQLVCRAWRLLLTSPGFRQDSASLALACHRLCLLWNPSCHESAKADYPLRVDLSFIPAKFRDPSVWKFWTAHRSHCWTVATTFFGIYGVNSSWVFHTKHGGKIWLCLVNLEEKTCTELPPLSLLPLSAQEPVIRDVGKVVEEPGGFFFHITVLLECDDDSVHTARYSSRVGVWTMCRLRGAIVEPQEQIVSGTLYKDNRVHILCADRGTTNPDKYYRLST